MLFHFANILLQMLLKGKPDTKIILQVIVAVVFGWVIDVLQGWVVIDENSWVMRIAALIFSVFFTALGMLCMVSMNLIQNPPDGFVKAGQPAAG